MSKERYVVKLGNLYANGARGWTTVLSEAFVFHDRDDCFGESHYPAKNWAEDHAATLRSHAFELEDPELRVTIELYTPPVVELKTTS